MKYLIVIPRDTRDPHLEVRLAQAVGADHPDAPWPEPVPEPPAHMYTPSPAQIEAIYEDCRRHMIEESDFEEASTPSWQEMNPEDHDQVVRRIEAIYEQTRLSEEMQWLIETLHGPNSRE